MKIIVLLPAYNEGEALPILVEKVDRELKHAHPTYRIVALSDGSSDDTLEVLRRLSQNYPIEILSHKINRGLGETVRDLFEFAADIADDNDVIVRMDADNTHEPSIISAMVSKMNSGYDVITASRFAKGGGQMGVSSYRAFISYCATLYMRLFFSIPGIDEYTCGFRAYRAGIIKKAISTFRNDFIQLKGLGFTCTLEKLIKLKLVGARFSEVPFTLRYDQKLGKSKMVASITTLGYLTLAFLYHWPWGGWRSQFRPKSR